MKVRSNCVYIISCYGRCGMKYDTAWRIGAKICRPSIKRFLFEAYSPFEIEELLLTIEEPFLPTLDSSEKLRLLDLQNLLSAGTGDVIAHAERPLRRHLNTCSP